MSQWKELKERVAGKWQLPVLLLSLTLLPLSIVRLRPPPSLLDPDQAIKQIDQSFSTEQFRRVIELGDLFLDRDPQKLSAQYVGRVHLYLGRSRTEAAKNRPVTSLSDWRRLGNHFETASNLRQPLVSSDYESWGMAVEHQGKPEQAIDLYEEALSLGAESPWDVRRHILELSMQVPNVASADIVEQLGSFLEDLGDRRLDLRIWAIERKLESLDELGSLDKATTLLSRNRQYFSDSEFQERFQYLEGWLLYSTGQHEEAETILRAVRNRVRVDHPVNAMTGWLLGRVVLSDDGPQRPIEALSFFEDVIIHQPRGRFAVASRLGRAEALAMLERHDEALESYQTAIGELERLKARPPINRRVLRTSLGLQAERQRQNGRLAESVQYAQLAVSLLDPADIEQTTVYLQQLGQVQQLLAEELDQQVSDRDLSAPPLAATSPAAREAFKNAARTFVGLAKVSVLNDSRAASATWRVAEMFARAGESHQASNLYATFAADRPEHPLAPRALLRVGQLQQASGNFAQAIEAYRECYRRFPKLLDSSRGLVPMARCFMAMGSDQLDLAERTLRIVLDESEVFTPQAPEFADALFLLAEVLHRRGQFEQAIATFEETLDRYADDSRGARARFLLADSFRQSGLALKADVSQAKYAEEMRQMRADADARFASARGLFRQMISEYDLLDPDRLTRAQRIYLRYALLYEADCAFEIQDYREALKLYEQAVGQYQDTTSALAAYVQIINSHVFLGEPQEARAALARARVLVKTVPDSAFTGSIGPDDREDWKRYFEWLERSELF